MRYEQVERQLLKEFIASFYSVQGLFHELIESELSSGLLYHYHLKQVKELAYSTTVAKLFASTSDEELLRYWNKHYQHDSNALSVSDHCEQKDCEEALLYRHAAEFEEGSYASVIRSKLVELAPKVEGISLVLGATKTDAALLSSVYGLSLVVHNALGYVAEKSLYPFANKLVQSYLDDESIRESDKIKLRLLYNISGRLPGVHNELVKFFCSSKSYYYPCGLKMLEGMDGLLLALGENYIDSSQEFMALSTQVKPESTIKLNTLQEEFKKQEECLKKLTCLRALHKQYEAVGCSAEAMKQMLQDDSDIIIAAEACFDKVERQLKGYLTRVHHINVANTVQRQYQLLCKQSKPHRKVHRSFLILTMLEKFKTLKQQGLASAEDHLALLQLIDQVREQNNQDRRLGQGNRFGQALYAALDGAMGHPLVEARFGVSASHEMRVLLKGISKQNRSRAHRRYIKIAQKKNIIPAVSAWHLERYKQCKDVISEQASSEAIDTAIDKLFSSLKFPQWSHQQREIFKAYADAIAHIKKVELNYLKQFEFDNETIEHVSQEQLKLSAEQAGGVIEKLSLVGSKLPAELQAEVQSYKLQSVAEIKEVSDKILRLFSKKAQHESLPDIESKKTISEKVKLIRNADTELELLQLFSNDIDMFRVDHHVLREAIVEKIFNDIGELDLMNFHLRYDAIIKQIESIYPGKEGFLKATLVKVKYRYYEKLLTQGSSFKVFMHNLSKIISLNSGDGSWAQTDKMKQLIHENILKRNDEGYSDIDEESETASITSHDSIISVKLTDCLGQTVFTKDYLTVVPQSPTRVLTKA